MHLTQKFVENFCTLVEKTKTVFASCKKVYLNFCKRVEKIKPKFKNSEFKNSELVFTHVLKIANLFVEKTFDLNKNYFDKIFINKYSIINRKIDTLTIYGTKTINKTIFNSNF